MLLILTYLLLGDGRYLSLSGYSFRDGLGPISAIMRVHFSISTSSVSIESYQLLLAFQYHVCDMFLGPITMTKKKKTYKYDNMPHQRRY